jgi:hypothetical protein
MTTIRSLLATTLVCVALLLLVGCSGSDADSPLKLGKATSTLSQTPPVDRCGSWNGITLVAKKTYTPPTAVDDQHHFCRPLTFTVPPSLRVVAGDAGVHKASLTFAGEGGPSTTCSYKGNQHGGNSPHATPGTAYVLESCSDRAPNAASRTASIFSMHIEMGDQKAGDTVVSVTIGNPEPPPSGPTPDQQFVATDAAIKGAALSVPLGAAPVSQAFSMALDPIVPAGHDIHPGDGLRPIVTLGPAVTFTANGAAEPYLFVATTPCTTITLPYDQAILDGYPGATPRAFQLLDPNAVPAGKVPVEPVADVMVDPTTHTISFCTAHLSTYTTGINRTNPISYIANGPVLTSPVNVYLIWYGGWIGSSVLTELPDAINALSGTPYLRTVSTFVTPDGVVPAADIQVASQRTLPNTKTSPLSDDDISGIVATELEKGTLPYDPNGFYAVILSDGLSQSGSAGVACVDFCAWHASSTYFDGTSTQRFRYAALIDPRTCPPVAAASGYTLVGSVYGCEAIQYDAGTKKEWAEAPNGDPIANKLLDGFAHELIEAISDPDSNTWRDASTSSWENADVCAWQFGTSPYTAPNGHTANLQLGSRDYFIQEELVNTTEGQYCAMGIQDAGLRSLTGPKRVQVGTVLDLDLQFWNKGEVQWAASSFGIKTVGLEPGWTPQVDFLGLSSSVGVGDIGDFPLHLVAPRTLGSHPFAARMYVNDGTTSLAPYTDGTTNAHFFGPTASTSIEVVNNNSQFVSQDVPESIRASSPGLADPFELSVSFVNAGTTPWSGDGPFVYGLLDVTNTMSTRFVALEQGEVIGPGEPKTFTFQITAPLSAVDTGIVSQWRMAMYDGVKLVPFGQTSPLKNIAVTPPVDFNSKFVSQSVPSVMVAGQKYPVTVTFNNNAPTPWSSAFDIKLRSQNPPLNNTWGLNAVPLDPTDSVVVLDQDMPFNFTVTAPSVPGNYDFQWMLQFCNAIGITCPNDHGWFGVPSDNVTVTVLASLDDSATYEPNVPDVSNYCSKEPMLSCYLQEGICVGHRYSTPPPITMLNSGGTTWSKAGGYALAVLDPSWGVGVVELDDSDAIRPGEIKTFHFDPVAPAPTGQFGSFAQIKFQMVHGSTKFGDATPDGLEEWITYCGG